jgi:hypothetical protein
MLRRTITAIVVLVSIFMVSNPAMGETSTDPIVGCWEGGVQIPGDPRDRIEARADGTVSLTLAGINITGTWRRTANGRYHFTPSGEDDYYTIQGAVLSAYDREGLIQTFHRRPCR